ncbi:hypothetical protein QYS49_39030 [Marivirga salinae]|uniref:DUF5034 domain-containing protein n=1 Tax=Marivirga salinarum TaxID=3059078 RepID=A0AA51NA55_9BACT|nr:hypothetical protein [Marivirga sp. BDSF4-3]WMN11617.1 hypothetical protein QYS49_39030 [Marivirga sp. BDSF4-3]
MIILRRTILIIAAIFTFQFLMSCLRCGPIPTLEMVYTDLSLELSANIDGQHTVYDDSVRKEDFLLLIFLNDQESQVADVKGYPNYGFSTAMAWQCPDPNFNYSDKVQSIKVLMINQEDTSQTIDMTNAFGSRYESETSSIKDQIDMQYENQELFSLYLSLLEYDEIYKKASFSVTANLESGKTFTQETEEVIFMD